MTVVSRRDYFDTAMGVLGEHGFAGLTIAAVCSRLGVTSGSFYHHFGSFERFVDALLADWASQQTAQIIAIVQGADVDPVRRFELMLEISEVVPRRAERAIRSWANNNAAVAVVQRRVDQARLAYVEDVVGALGLPGSSPARLAMLILAAFVGLESLDDLVDPTTYTGVAEELRGLVLGALADERGEA